MSCALQNSVVSINAKLYSISFIFLMLDTIHRVAMFDTRLKVALMTRKNIVKQ